MANHKSAKKRSRQTVIRNARNRSLKSKIKTSTKDFFEALESDNQETKQKALSKATSAIYRCNSKGVINKRKAARQVSRLAKQLNKS